MSWLFPSHNLGPDPGLEAAIARNLAAQRRVVRAADEAAETAVASREQTIAAVDGMKQRTQARLAKRGYGRRAADSALEQMADRVKRELGDDP